MINHRISSLILYCLIPFSLLCMDDTTKKNLSIQDLINQGTLPQIRPNGALILENLKLTSLDGIENISNKNLVFVLILDNNLITELAPSAFNHFPNLAVLSIRNNPITFFPQGIFDKLHNLIFLVITATKITAFPPHVFDKLTNLQQLHIHNHNALSLPETIFDNLINLTYLSLSNNKLEAIKLGWFKNLHNLEIVELDHNNLTTLPRHLLNGCTLKALCLQKNRLSHLEPKLLYSQNRLCTLKLNSNCITHIDQNFFNDCSNLTHIDLSENTLLSIHPQNIRTLEKLKVLHLKNNPQLDLPEQTIDLIAERNIYIGETTLLKGKQSSRSFADVLKQLTAENRLHEIFHSIEEQATIIINDLNLRDVDLPEGMVFPGLEMVTEISARNNALTEIPFEALKMFPNLRRLNLSGNKIKYVSKKIKRPMETEQDYFDFFDLHTLGKSCPHLESLKLRGNEIEEIFLESFEDLPELEHLDLSNNRIRYIQLFAFMKLKKLKSCFLNNNKLQTLTCFGNNPLEIIDVSENMLGNSHQYQYPNTIKTNAYYPQCAESLRIQAAKQVVRKLETFGHKGTFAQFNVGFKLPDATLDDLLTVGGSWTARIVYLIQTLKKILNEFGTIPVNIHIQKLLCTTPSKKWIGLIESSHRMDNKYETREVFSLLHYSKESAHIKKLMGTDWDKTLYARESLKNRLKNIQTLAGIESFRDIECPNNPPLPSYFYVTGHQYY